MGHALALGEGDRQAFHDVTARQRGDAARRQAHRRADRRPRLGAVTGWGRPDAQALVPLLVRQGRSSGALWR